MTPMSARLLMVALALMAPAAAQDVPLSKSVRTQKVVPMAQDPMIGTDDDGRLLIDWQMAEELALSATADPRRASLARLMLAIRDGQWKPMPIRQ
jgi:hypothetical protein